MRTHLLAAACLFVATSAGAQQAPTPIAQRTANDGNVVLSGVPEVPDSLLALVDRYGDVRSASFSDWTADGSGIYVATRFGNTTQLHRVDRPGGARRQITFFDEPVGGAERRPRGRELLFGMDQGGAEFYQLFLLDPRTGAVRRLTDGESRNGNAEWSPDGQRIAFTSTRRNGRSNDIWMMEVADTSSARLLLDAPEGGASWGVSDWSPDGSRVLVTEYVSANDSRVHLVDVATGERRRVAGGKPAAGWFGLAFTPVGEGAFVTTDSRGEFRQLAVLDLLTERLRVLTGEIPWDVEGFTLGHDGRRAAFTVNEGGRSRLYLLDPRSYRFAPVEGVPVGLIGGLEFSPDGKRLGMTLNNATTPSDAFSLELGADPLSAGKLVRWTDSETGGLDPQTFVSPELIEYRTFDGRMIPAWVYRPQGPGPHPVIVDIHGGPEGQERPGFSSTVQLWGNQLGAAVVAPNVRGSAGYGKEYLKLDNAMKREDSVKDIGALLDWIGTQPGLDGDRVAVYGGSYGGYMVLASMVHYSPRLRAGVDIVGISDFISFLENTQEYRRDLRRPEYGDERDPKMRAFFERIAPARNADRITAPLFVIQGQNDPRVPVTEAEQIVRVVRSNGRPVWYMNALNDGHGYRKQENRDLMNAAVVMFLREHLLGTPTRSAAAAGR
ncbi:S9 family peptidase [soil metagenome]